MISKKTGTIPYGPVAPILTSGTPDLSVTWYPDETYWPALREAAESQGVTPQQVAQETMSWGISQGWSYAVPSGVTTVFFSQADIRAISETLGCPMQSVTGAAIAAMIGRMAPKEKLINKMAEITMGKDQVA